MSQVLPPPSPPKKVAPGIQGSSLSAASPQFSMSSLLPSLPSIESARPFASQNSSLTNQSKTHVPVVRLAIPSDTHTWSPAQRRSASPVKKTSFVEMPTNEFQQGRTSAQVDTIPTREFRSHDSLLVLIDLSTQFPNGSGDRFLRRQATCVLLYILCTRRVGTMVPPLLLVDKQTSSCISSVSTMRIVFVCCRRVCTVSTVTRLWRCWRRTLAGLRRTQLRYGRL